MQQKIISRLRLGCQSFGFWQSMKTSITSSFTWGVGNDAKFTPYLYMAMTVCIAIVGVAIWHSRRGTGFVVEEMGTSGE